VIGGFTWYVVAGSVWFNRCGAQLDPISLGPVNCQEKDEKPTTQCPEFSLWPAFGSCNRTYEGLGGFWGDDLISKAFSTIGETAGGTLRPVLRDHVVPSWNGFFAEKSRRDATMWVIGLFTTALAGELVKEWWTYSRHRDTKPEPKSDE
jgi:hypothetical protein